MLKGLAEDFSSAGHSATVLLDDRLAAVHPNISAEHIVQISGEGQVDSSMELASETADAAFVIAPEPNQVLQSIVECIETTGTLSLNCAASAIEQVADKQALSDRVGDLGLNFPVTLAFINADSLEDIVQEVGAHFEYPVVVKPSSSAGCGGLSLAKNPTELATAICKVKAESSRFIIQPYLQGIPASISLLSTGTNALPLSLNLQDIDIASPNGISSYNGGAVPFQHPLKEEAFNAAKQLVEHFEGLRGYVGVDVILGEDAVYVMEINPRLTTSYVGLRRVARFNVADAIANAVTRNQLPEIADTEGYCGFTKFPTSAVTQSVFEQFSAESFVVAPPFPIDTAESCALLEATAATPQEATSRLVQAKKQLCHITAGGQLRG
jgi:predicted ATP-grasp superfamily ATP-dependent carboligase